VQYIAPNEELAVKQSEKFTGCAQKSAVRYKKQKIKFNIQTVKE